MLSEELLILFLVQLHQIMISRVLSGVYVIGGGASMVLLSVALFIFCYFKSLHCKRIWIHSNLVVAFIMRHVLLFVRLRSVLPFILMTDHTRDKLVESQMPTMSVALNNTDNQNQADNYDYEKVTNSPTPLEVRVWLFLDCSYQCF
jgi:hypothetical protein